MKQMKDRRAAVNANDAGRLLRHDGGLIVLQQDVAVQNRGWAATQTFVQWESPLTLPAVPQQIKFNARS
jgi:hypothetical protein